MSRWSGSPASTQVSQVPHTPSSHALDVDALLADKLQNGAIGRYREHKSRALELNFEATIPRVVDPGRGKPLEMDA